MTDQQSIQIKVSPDNGTGTILGKRKKSCLQRRSSSVPPRISSIKDEEYDDDRLIPRPSSSMSVRFSPEPPQVYEYPPATIDSKPETDKSQRGPILALPWHPT